jgi:hypothetical protein
MALTSFRAVVLPAWFAILMLLPTSRGAEETALPSASNAEELGSTEPSRATTPYTNWRRFRRTLIRPLAVAYTADFELGSPHHRSVFGPEEIERTRRYFHRALERQVADHYPIVTRSGPDVLRIEAILVNPVLDRSDWLQPGRAIWRRTAEIFGLAVVLRDSENGALLHEIELGPLTSHLAVEEGPVRFWGRVRRVFDRAARRVRWTLETPPAVVARGSHEPASGAHHRSR